MNDIYFYKNTSFINTVDAKSLAEELASTNINYLNKNIKEAKTFQEEALPIIIAAECLKFSQIKFTCTTNAPMDAVLKGNDKELYVECTTSINGQFNDLNREYLSRYGCCITAPHSKLVPLENIKNANASDIVCCGTKNNRQIISQDELVKLNLETFEDGIINVDKYIDIDKEIIQNKVNKGNNENKYKDFLLILVCEHDLPNTQINNPIQEYQKKMFQYWSQIENNPFKSLFVLSYKVFPPIQIKAFKKMIYPIPTPILFVQ